MSFIGTENDPCLQLKELLDQIIRSGRPINRGRFEIVEYTIPKATFDAAVELHKELKL